MDEIPAREPDPAPARIFLRPIGSPLTLGLSGLAIASFVQSGLELGWVSKGEGVQIGLILLAIPFMLQTIASIFAYLARDGAAGAANGVLAGSWLAVGLVDIASGTRGTTGALGLMLLASAGVLGCSAVALAGAKPLASGIYLLAAIRFACAGIYQLSVVGTWQHAAGIIGLVVTAGAAYGVLAFELEGQQHRPVLPTMRRGVGEEAISNGRAAQVNGVENEAGVRQTT
jgi:hypothetical protein